MKIIKKLILMGKDVKQVNYNFIMCTIGEEPCLYNILYTNWLYNMNSMGKK